MADSPSTAAACSSYSDDRLLDLLATEEDRLTRAPVDEFIARGGRMIEPLTRILETEKDWTEGDPWRQIHAAYILGAIGGEAAIPGLLAALRHSQTEDFTYDELNGELPHIFASIGPAAVAPLLARSREAESWERSWIFSALTCIAKLHPDRREEICDALRAVCEDEGEPLRARASAGCELLDFVRPQDRDLLIELGRLQKKSRDPKIFFDATVRDQYEKGPVLGSPPPLDWLRNFDPPQEVPDELPEPEEPDAFLEDFDPDALAAPDAPVRVGRNDPCPCGSGKKYKKCCEGR